jgi:hypothetical protein
MRAILGAVVGATLIVSMPAAAAAQVQPAAPSKTADKPTEAATPVDPASLALANQILAIGFPPEKRSQMFTSVMNSFVAQLRKTMDTYHAAGDKDMQAVVDRSMQRMYDQVQATFDADLPDYFDSMAHAYGRLFSPDDLRAILAFVKTPAGQHFFERGARIMQDPNVQAANQRMMAKLMTKLPDLQSEMIKDVKDYLAKKEKQAKPAAPVPVS